MVYRTFKISERSLGSDAYSFFRGSYVSPAFLYSDIEMKLDKMYKIILDLKSKSVFLEK